MQEDVSVDVVSGTSIVIILDSVPPFVAFSNTLFRKGNLFPSSNIKIPVWVGSLERLSLPDLKKIGLN